MHHSSGERAHHFTVYMKSWAVHTCATVCNGYLTGPTGAGSQADGIQNSRALSHEGGTLDDSSSGESPRSLWFRTHPQNHAGFLSRWCQCIPRLCEQSVSTTQGQATPGSPCLFRASWPTQNMPRGTEGTQDYPFGLREYSSCHLHISVVLVDHRMEAMLLLIAV